MKQIACIFVIAFLISFNIFSEDEFTGDWKIEVIGTDAQWELIHNDEETTLIVDNNSSKENITINTTDKKVIIPGFNTIADEFDYVINPDGTIDLLVSGKFNIDLAKAFTNGIDVEKAPNSITVDAYKTIISEFEILFHKIPILRLRKI